MKNFFASAVHSVYSHLLVAACGAAIAAGSANAQWSVVFLGQGSGASSAANATDGHTQGGYSAINNVRRAAMWQSSTASFVDLYPPGSIESTVTAVEGNTQIGYVYFAAARPHGALWHGSAASFVNLTPAGMYGSEVVGIYGDSQFGTLFQNDRSAPRATAWHGSADARTDLNPAGATSSGVLWVDGDAQYGSANFPGTGNQFGLWHGTAASWTPVSFNVRDVAFTSVYGNQFGGWFQEDIRFGFNAAVWGTTQDSFVNLDSTHHSTVQSVGRGRQVGWSSSGQIYHAVYWSSTAASRLDLHQFLPANYASGGSSAYGIFFTNDATYVVGSANLPNTDRYDAVMWVGPAVSCFLINDPVSTLHCPGASGSSQLSVSTLGSRGTLTYQWTHDGVPVDASQNPSAATATITVSGPASGGEYRCTITDSCGSVTSGPATVTICFAEFNCDGFLDFFDYDDFVVAFEAGDPSSDVNGDGFLDFFDYGDFVAAFETGC